MNIEERNLKELFELADVIGKKRYHQLTSQDFENYRKYDYWRYINGKYECGTTQESKNWVRDNSDHFCPVCGRNYSQTNWKTIDHKLPRSQYPWLSMEFKNLWVICRDCNEEKAEMHWYEYERHIYLNYLDFYPVVRDERPFELLQALKA